MVLITLNTVSKMVFMAFHIVSKKVFMALKTVCTVVVIAVHALVRKVLIPFTAVSKMPFMVSQIVEKKLLIASQAVITACLMFSQRSIQNCRKPSFVFHRWVVPDRTEEEVAVAAIAAGKARFEFGEKPDV